MLSYLPVIGSFFSKTNTDYSVESFLRTFETVTHSLLYGLYHNNDHFTVDFEMIIGGERAKFETYKEAWISFLRECGIRLIHLREQSFRIESNILNATVFLLKFLTIVRSICLDLTRKETRISCKSSSFAYFMRDCGFHIEDKLYLPVSYT